MPTARCSLCLLFLQAEDGIRDYKVTGVQTCALPISIREAHEKHLRTIELDAGNHQLAIEELLLVRKDDTGRKMSQRRIRGIVAARDAQLAEGDAAENA